jgi:hypothetical protein
MFRRYKSGGDEPGTRDEIVIKVDPIVPKSAPVKSGKAAPPAKAGKGAAAARAKSAASGKSAPAKSGKSAASGKSATPAKSGKSAASGKSGKSPVPPKSGKSGAPAKASKPGKRRFAWRIGDLLTGGSDEQLERELELELEDDEVEVKSRAAAEEKRRAELEAELQRQAEEFGLAAADPISLYGPNGEEVAALIESLADMDDDLAEEIADSYELTPEAERKVAQSVVRRRHRSGKLWMELETAEGAVADWFSALGLVEDEDIALYSIVADAATDAVDALVLVDELADADYTTLYGPWSEVMDVDEGDEEADDEAEPEGKAEEESEEDAEEEGEFGPNTALVTELLTRLGTLDTATTAELIDVWREQSKEDLRLAHRSLQALADESDKWREQMRLAQEEVFAWMDRGATRFNKLRAAAGDWARTREIAGPAVADAVAALVMADVLETEDATTLYAPWAQVIGEPEMPVYEDEPEEEEPKKSAKPKGGAEPKGGAKPAGVAKPSPKPSSGAKPKGGPKLKSGG